jgi:hypothetical protein
MATDDGLDPPQAVSSTASVKKVSTPQQVFRTTGPYAALEWSAESQLSGVKYMSLRGATVRELRHAPRPGRGPGRRPTTIPTGIAKSGATARRRPRAADRRP